MAEKKKRKKKRKEEKKEAIHSNVAKIGLQWFLLGDQV